MNNFNIRNFKIRTQLLSVMLALVTIPIVVLGTSIYLTAKQATIKQVENDLQNQTTILLDNVHNIYHIALDKVSSDLNVARYIIYNTGQPKLDPKNLIKITAVNQITHISEQIVIPTMKINDQQLLFNYQIVDEIKQKVGSTATIFQVIPDGILRISTNVLNRDQSRAVGTYIPKNSPVYQTIIKGKTFRGRAFVVNDWYLTAYEPIKDQAGQLIGVLYVGVKEEYYQEAIKKSFAKFSIGKTGYIYILNSKGDYILSYKNQRDGENIWDSQDSQGNYFIRNIIQNALNSEREQSNISYYFWQNKNDSQPRRKLASYIYFPEWDWIIGASAYEDEYFSELRQVKNLTIFVSVFFIIVATMIASIFAQFISSAVNLMVSHLQEIAQGNLTILINKSVRYNQEINQMIDSFDLMLQQLKNIVTNLAITADNVATNSLEVATNVKAVNIATDNISLVITDITQNTQETNKSAQQSSEAATEAALKIQRISNSVSATTQVVNHLKETTKEINYIIKVIHAIAQQTNLLAFNASIEAGRAGEYGKEFNVIAVEIRKLAQEVQKSITKIETSIEDIVKSVNQTSITMEQSNLEVNAGSKVIADALESLDHVSEKVADITLQINSLTTCENRNYHQQTASIAEISDSMREISSVVDKLAITATELKHLVNQFKI